MDSDSIPLIYMHDSSMTVSNSIFVHHQSSITRAFFITTSCVLFWEALPDGDSGFAAFAAFAVGASGVAWIYTVEQ